MSPSIAGRQGGPDGPARARGTGTERDRPDRGPVPVDHLHGAGGRHRPLDRLRDRPVVRPDVHGGRVHPTREGPVRPRGDGRGRGAGGGPGLSDPEPMIPTPTIHVAREQNHLAWDPAIPPVATVGSGEMVAFDCLDASNGQLTADSTTASLETLVFDQVDQVTGPVEVAGAEPGDTLQVDILELEPAGWGWTANIPGFGLLANEFSEPFYKTTAVPGPTGTAEFWPGIRVPVAPF